MTDERVSSGLRHLFLSGFLFDNSYLPKTRMGLMTICFLKFSFNKMSLIDVLNQQHKFSGDSRTRVYTCSENCSKYINDLEDLLNENEKASEIKLNNVSKILSAVYSRCKYEDNLLVRNESAEIISRCTTKRSQDFLDSIENFIRFLNSVTKERNEFEM